MAKTKTFYQCSECGFESPQWLGKCSVCGAWNALEEKVIHKGESILNREIEAPELSSRDREKFSPLTEQMGESGKRLFSGIKEFDRVLGGGLFEGSVTLISGEPGIGKSTLLLQAAYGISNKNLVLYVSAEESIGQIAARAKRLGIQSENLVVVSENNLLTILSFLKETKPALLILDSIQAVYHPEFNQAAGSLTQIRDSAALLERYARETNTTLMIVGHVTKEGMLAGPKTLEHLVDTVIYFEGDRYENLRMLRAVKNRNGSTGEIGLFEMVEKGLEEVENPSALFMGSRGDSQGAGRSLSPILEGGRTLVTEIQALVTPTVYPNPVRRFTGVDMSQATLLVAIIEKNLKLNLSKSDIFLKISGGLFISEIACDLGVALAIVSSFLNKELSSEVAVIGELGLGGEVRPVKALDERIRECERLGLKKMIIPRQKRRVRATSLELCEVSSLTDAYQILIKNKG